MSEKQEVQEFPKWVTLEEGATPVLVEDQAGEDELRKAAKSDSKADDSKSDSKSDAKSDEKSATKGSK